MTSYLETVDLFLDVVHLYLSQALCVACSPRLDFLYLTVQSIDLVSTLPTVCPLKVFLTYDCLKGLLLIIRNSGGTLHPSNSNLETQTTFALGDILQVGVNIPTVT